MVLGFIFHDKRNSKLNINKFLDAMLWILSLSVIIFIIIISYIFATPYISRESSLLSNAIFMSIHRVAWSVAISYIIFASEFLKSGSIVRKILSHSSWKPIGTKGLSLYITHLVYMMFMMMNQRQPFDFTIWKMVIKLNFN